MAACSGPGFERALAASLTHRLDVGARAAIGMEREGGWVTQLIAAGESSGFFAAAGGLAWRQPTGVTPRFELAAGVAARSFNLGGECTIANEEETCQDGLGPYGEASVGLDWPLGVEAPDLTFALGGTAYLNSDVLESRLVLAVGVTWK
jgi:hypothetical protein